VAFAADAFEQSQDGYLSPVERAPFPFTAAGVHFKPGGIDGSFLTLHLRLRADGGDWSPWYPLEGFEPQADGRLYGENLVAWPQAHEVQVRVHAPGALRAALQDLNIVAIDASGGPTTAQAVLSARSAVAQGDPGLPQPTVISRADWGADEDWMTWPPEYAPVDKMMVHHTVSGGGGDPAAEVRAIYYYHAVTRGWGDIGYNFLVDRLGNVYEGRYGGPDVIGAHVAYWNAGSLGVSVLGCYDNGACSAPQTPTAATLNALADLVAWTASRRGIDPRALRDYDNGDDTVTRYVLSGHRDYGTTVCPGGNLYAQLPDLRLAAWERLPDYDVRFGWQDTPPSLYSGQQATVYPNLYNYGRLVWSDDDGVRLGYRWLKDGQTVAENTAAARILPGAVVNLGEMTALVAQLTAPVTPGTFTLRWDLYRDGAGWFADQPAPVGRSQPLDLTVEVLSVLSLSVQTEPPAVVSGTPISVGVTVGGPAGQAFEVNTRLPPQAIYVPGSGQSDSGSPSFDPTGMSWIGTWGDKSTQASFVLTTSPELDQPLALPITTTLDGGDYGVLVLEHRLIINGYTHYLPLLSQRRTD
jgi:hypothetical protein